MLTCRMGEDPCERKRCQTQLPGRVDQVWPNLHRDPCLVSENRVCRQTCLFLLQSLKVVHKLSAIIPNGMTQASKSQTYHHNDLSCSTGFYIPRHSINGSGLKCTRGHTLINRARDILAHNVALESAGIGSFSLFSFGRRPKRNIVVEMCSKRLGVFEARGKLMPQ